MFKNPEFVLRFQRAKKIKSIGTLNVLYIKFASFAFSFTTRSNIRVLKSGRRHLDID